MNAQKPAQVPGIIFDIQRFSIHDGPGIRTTVFLKGCPLRCRWCHNPESISPHIEPDRDKAGAFFGRAMTVGDVMTVVRRDKAYYLNSGGGVTLSGGEPMRQFIFTKALLNAAHTDRIHTCLDTCGAAPRHQFEELLDLVDLFHFDYKATDPDHHLKWTGAPRTPILENLRFLYHQNADIVLRCPIIPGLNDTKQHFKGISALVAEMPRLQIELLPYHDMARDKWRRIGKVNPLPDVPRPDKKMKAHWKATLLECGVPENRLKVSS